MAMTKLKVTLKILERTSCSTTSDCAAANYRFAIFRRRNEGTLTCDCDEVCVYVLLYLYISDFSLRILLDMHEALNHD